MVKWVNRGVIQGARNGTTSHTFAFGFTATAGRLLVAIGYGAVTFTTPSGWTLRQSAVNSGGLYVWTKTAAGGETSFTTTHNGSNYPCALGVYEFPSGSAWGSSVTGTNIAIGGANPNLTGLTGTNQLFATLGNVNNSQSVGWTGATEDYDITVATSPTDGYCTSLAYVEDSTATSFAPTGVISGGFPKEAITFSLTVPSGGGTQYPVTGTVAVTSTASGAPAARKVTTGTSPIVSTASASPKSLVGVSGTVPVVSTDSGDVVRQTPVSGTVTNSSLVSGSPGILIPVSGTVDIDSTASGSVSRRIATAGTVTIISGASGNPQLPGGMTGTVPITSAVSGSVGVRKPATGVVVATSNSSGSVGQRKAVAGTVLIDSDVEGEVFTSQAVDGLVVMTSDSFGEVLTAYMAFGVTAIISTASGYATGASAGSIYHETELVLAVKYGTTDVLRIYHGSTLIWGAL